MFEYTKEDLNIMAKEFNFNRDTLEKVIRLIKILDFINTDSQIKEKLVLKGGSAKYNSIFYGGESIEGRAYDYKNDIFINTYKDTKVPNASNAFGISYRRWNFYGM